MNDEFISSQPMSDVPSARELAREAIATYRSQKVLVEGQYCTLPDGEPPPYLTQADIDGKGSRDTAEYTRRAVRGYHA